MSTGSILSMLAYPQYGYHLVYHTGVSLVHFSYLSVLSLHRNGQTIVVCESVGQKGMRMNCVEGDKPGKYE